jgi:hypothetical protein
MTTTPEQKRIWYQNNKAKTIERSAKWAEENKVRRLEITSKWARENPQSHKNWVKANPERRREIARDWIRNNTKTALINTNIYRHKKNRASPPWLIKDEMSKIYMNCPSGYHVDHIVPIKGITPDGYFVSGLNVPWNLQYLTGIENTSKRNKMTNRCYEIATSLKHEQVIDAIAA